MSITDNTVPRSAGAAEAPRAPEAGGAWVRRHLFLLAFGLVALVIAGILSYAASSSPDGLDSTTLRGCETVVVDGAEQLRGNCIAQHAGDHAMSSSPLADYSVAGLGADSGGVAGVIGVVVTLLVAGGLFWLLARGRRHGAGR